MFKIKFRKEYFSYLIIVTFFSVGLLLLSCRKEKPIDPWNTLPEATQDGANTMGFYANDELYVTMGQPYSWPGYFNHVMYYGTKLSNVQLRMINAKLRGGWDFDIALPDSVFTNSNEYELGSCWPIGASFSRIEEGKIGKIPYRTTPDHKLLVTYTRYEAPDGVGKICSGTFSGEMINGNGDVLIITEGRFDIAVPTY